MNKKNIPEPCGVKKVKYLNKTTLVYKLLYLLA